MVFAYLCNISKFQSLGAKFCFTKLLFTKEPDFEFKKLILLKQILTGNTTFWEILKYGDVKKLIRKRKVISSLE